MTYQVILEPGIDRSFSCVRARLSAYLYTFVGNFSYAKIDLREARERELAKTRDKKTPKQWAC